MSKMEKPDISYHEAMQQASQTVDDYLMEAIVFIDKHLGDGYAAKHPELLGLCVVATAVDFHTTTMTNVLFEIKDAIKTIP